MKETWGKRVIFHWVCPGSSWILRLAGIFWDGNEQGNTSKRVASPARRPQVRKLRGRKMCCVLRGLSEISKCQNYPCVNGRITRALFCGSHEYDRTDSGTQPGQPNKENSPWQKLFINIESKSRRNKRKRPPFHFPRVKKDPYYTTIAFKFQVCSKALSDAIWTVPLIPPNNRSFIVRTPR